MRTVSSTRKRRDGQDTVDRVIRFARVELAEHGPVGFNLDRVIAASAVSRGSIYHHFGNRAGLITAVETMNLLSTYQAANQATRDIAERASSGSELIDWMSTILRVSASEEGRRGRSRRIATLAAADQIPALHSVLSKFQREGVDYYVDTLSIACERGLIDPAAPLSGIANLIQSLLLGRALVDLLDDADQDEAWVQAAIATLTSLLKPSQSVRGDLRAGPDVDRDELDV